MLEVCPPGGVNSPPGHCFEFDIVVTLVTKRIALPDAGRAPFALQVHSGVFFALGPAWGESWYDGGTVGHGCPQLERGMGIHAGKTILWQDVWGREFQRRFPRAGGIVGYTMTGGDVGYKAGLGELPRLETVDLI